VVTARSGYLYFGGRYIRPPYELQYIGPDLIANGRRLRVPPHPKGPHTPARVDSLRHDLSLQSDAIVEAAYADEVTEAEVIEHLARFYRRSDLVEAVKYDSTRLEVTYKGARWPVRILLPPRSLSGAELRARTRARRTQDIMSLKASLESGDLVLIFTQRRVSIPHVNAQKGHEVFQRYQRGEGSEELGKFLQLYLWKYLLDPQEVEAAHP
jgi:hypothetical protein